MLLQLSFLNATANFVKVDLLSSDQCLLQISSNLNCLDGIGQLHWERSVVQASGREIIGLLNKSRSETPHEVGWNFPSDTSRGIIVHKVSLRVAVDSKLALCTDNFGSVLLPVGHHAGAVVVGNLSILELDNSNSVIVVLVPTQLRLNGSNTVSRDTLRNNVVAKEPKSEIDIVHTHIDKHTSGPGGIFDEESRWVMLITGLTSNDGRATDESLFDLVVDVAVRVVEPAGEATHYLQVRLFAGCIDNLLALSTRCVSVVN